MATGGVPVFDREAHGKLLKLRKEFGWTDSKLAAEFDCSVPTVRKWLSLPLGTTPRRGGRRKKGSAATEPGSPKPSEDGSATTALDDTGDAA